MGIYRITFDIQLSDGERAFSFFLLFIAVLSTATTWTGIRILAFKRRTGSHLNMFDLGLSSSLVFIAVTTMFIGWQYHFAFLLHFPIIGILLGSGQLYYWLTTPKIKMPGYFEHFVNLIGCPIATITAFIVFSAPRLLNISSVSVWLWFLPTILLTPLIYIIQLVLQKKFQIKPIQPNRLKNYRKTLYLDKNFVKLSWT